MNIEHEMEENKNGEIVWLLFSPYDNWQKVKRDDFHVA